eukprot:UN28457
MRCLRVINGLKVRKGSLVVTADEKVTGRIKEFEEGLKTGKYKLGHIIGEPLSHQTFPVAEQLEERDDRAIRNIKIISERHNLKSKSPERPPRQKRKQPDTTIMDAKRRKTDPEAASAVPVRPGKTGFISVSDAQNPGVKVPNIFEGIQTREQFAASLKDSLPPNFTIPEEEAPTRNIQDLKEQLV